jgi:D-glycero-D-manno-heptose 1,7-bisphosphate phosphatase
MPAPGLFEKIAERWGVSLQGVPVLGDQLCDVQAGFSAGCEPHLVLTGLGAQWRDQPLAVGFPANTQVHQDLAAFVDHWLARQTSQQKQSKKTARDKTAVTATGSTP